MNDIHFIKNKNFRTLIIRFLYPFKIKRDDLASISILPSLLLNTSEKFKEEDEFQKEFLKNYILNFSCNRIEIDKQGFFNFNLTIPSPETIDDDFIDRAIRFFIETIYKPNVNDNQFDLKQFEREKECLKIGLENAKKNINSYSIERVYEIIDEDGHLTTDLYHNEYLLSEISSKKTYKFYEKTIKQYNPIIFVSGNFKTKKIIHIFDKYLYNEKRKINNFTTDYNYFLTTKKLKNIKEEGPFHQSALYLIYKVKNMKEKDRLFLFLISALLSSQSSNLLHKNLRDDGNLVYSTYSSTLSHNAVLIMEALINKNSKEEAINRIKQTIKELKNKQIIIPLLQNIKDRRRINLKRKKDDHYSLVSEEINKFLKIDKTLEEEYEIIKDITSEDIIKFAERLELDTIYFMEGNKNGK